MGKTSTDSADTSSISREVAHLAFTKVKQDDWLNIRQQEQLRRALMALGEALGWAVTSANSEDPIAVVEIFVEFIVNQMNTRLVDEFSDLIRFLMEGITLRYADDTLSNRVARLLRRERTDRGGRLENQREIRRDEYAAVYDYSDQHDAANAVTA